MKNANRQSFFADMKKRQNKLNAAVNHLTASEEAEFFKKLFAAEDNLSYLGLAANAEQISTAGLPAGLAGEKKYNNYRLKYKVAFSLVEKMLNPRHP